MTMFQLAIQPLPNAERSLIVFQRPYSLKQNLPEQNLPVEVGSIKGLALSSAWESVLDILRADHYKPAALRTSKKKLLELSEASGVRLALLFNAIAPLTNLDHIRAIQQAISAMSDEEAYYWFAKCQHPNGVRALQVLFA